ncbi:transporter substrate-binding domain-containing protein [Pseudodesulfovibrio sp. zrk46]|uniref:transporter substrate-binding domain-containing protein n=1 Tax=Pseudodesulfovibrio sp. zrk46 TaxID=2725288 RepID=UPI001448B233|nr:transporter substrate-binding domain-containing protein [Pseudodesulfovibrio sp. zrk46]QJB57317.1 transporter substrate-binding domain-containing protein [Pseudodesulfovibrio sp. zrk46]
MKQVSLLLWVIIWCVAMPFVSEASDLSESFREGVIVVHSKTMAPLSSIGYNGEPKGIVIDVWRKWSEKTGVPVEFQLVQWDETLKRVRAGGNVIHGGLFKTPLRNEFLNYSVGYLAMKTSLVVLKDSPIKNMDEIAGRSIGVLKGGASEEYIHTHHPQAKIVPFNTVLDSARALADRKVEAVFMDYPTIMYMGGSLGAVGDFVPLEFVDPRLLHAAVAKGNDKLLELVNEGFGAITKSELQYIYDHWFVPPAEDESNWVLIFVLVCAGFLIGLVILYFGLPLPQKWR